MFLDVMFFMEDPLLREACKRKTKWKCNCFFKSLFQSVKMSKVYTQKECAHCKYSHGTNDTHYIARLISYRIYRKNLYEHLQQVILLQVSNTYQHAIYRAKILNRVSYPVEQKNKNYSVGVGVQVHAACLRKAAQAALICFS